jgi:hypothetical protein
LALAVLVALLQQMEHREAIPNFIQQYYLLVAVLEWKVMVVLAVVLEVALLERVQVGKATQVAHQQTYLVLVL